MAKTYREITDTKGFLTALKDAMGLIGNGSSAYRSYELPNGDSFVMRISNHNARAYNAKDGERVESIVIKRKHSPNRFEPSNGKTVDEYVYFKEDIRKAPVGTLSAIAESISELLGTGEYHDRTGLARENHSPEASTEDVRFRESPENMRIYNSQGTVDFMNELKRLREESTGGKALLQRGTGKMDMSEDAIAKRTAYAEAFRKAAEKYKESLRASMKWSTASVQELYQEILEDIDHSIDYYDRLAKGEEVWRTESTRYRDESPIDRILDKLQKLEEDDNKTENDKLSAIKEMEEYFGTPVDIVYDIDEAKASDIEAAKRLGEGKNVRAWYTKDGKIAVYIPNNASVPAVRVTVMLRWQATRDCRGWKWKRNQ